MVSLTSEAKTGKNSSQTELPMSYSNEDIDDARIDKNIWQDYICISKRERAAGQWQWGRNDM